MPRATVGEKPTLLGARVYKKHRKMLRDLADIWKKKSKKSVSIGEANRLSIEETHARYFPA